MAEVESSGSLPPPLVIRNATTGEGFEAEIAKRMKAWEGLLATKARPQQKG
jgi:hypothetical protein